MLPFQMLTRKVLSLSMYYSIRIWATCYRNLNQIVWSKITKFELFHKKNKAKLNKKQTNKNKQTNKQNKTKQKTKRNETKQNKTKPKKTQKNQKTRFFKKHF